MTVSSNSTSPTASLPPEDSRSRWIIGGLSVFVVLAVSTVMAAQSFLSSGTTAVESLTRNEPTVLARINVGLNAGAASFLLAGFAAIRRRRLDLHKKCMLAAFALSSIFLVTYLLHHAQVGSVPFLGQGAIRVVYFGLLIPHIVLAAGIVPLALFTVYRGWTGRFELHKTVARYTLPLWLFVSLSGVAVYFLLYSCTA